jgi:hypothetical protein
LEENVLHVFGAHPLLVEVINAEQYIAIIGRGEEPGQQEVHRIAGVQVSTGGGGDAGSRHGNYLRYTDDFLLFSNEKNRLWELNERVIAELSAVRLELALPKSRLLTTWEGVPFCGFVLHAGLRPRVLGATKRRFEARRQRLCEEGDLRQLTASIFAWYQFSREGNAEGLRQAWSRPRKKIHFSTIKLQPLAMGLCEHADA